MSLTKLYNRIIWENDTTPALNDTNLNAMSKAIDDIDDRVIDLGADVMEAVPELQEMIEEMGELSSNPPYIGANGNWWVWDTNISAYVDSGVDASITFEIADVTMLAEGATPYVTNTGTNTDPIFHLFVPIGATGATGQTGATPNISMSATADALSSDNPSVQVTPGGTAAAPTFALAFSGLKGTKGDTGNTGATGADGISPGITITTITGGHKVTITDKDHPNGQDFNVMDGEDGTDGTNGQDGSDGVSPGVTITTITGGHRVTITDAEHPNGQYFDVMDGTGSGDMQASVYDSNGDVATAGGIVAYINDVITDALTASY